MSINSLFGVLKTLPLCLLSAASRVSITGADGDVCFGKFGVFGGRAAVCMWPDRRPMCVIKVRKVFEYSGVMLLFEWKRLPPALP